VFKNALIGNHANFKNISVHPNFWLQFLKVLPKSHFWVKVQKICKKWLNVFSFSYSQPLGRKEYSA